MTKNIVKVQSVFACEDIRYEASGKILALGILNPVIGDPKVSDGDQPIVASLHFILSLDVPEAGEFYLRFRLRPLGGKGSGSSVKLRVQFLEAAKNIPFPIGPMRIRPDAAARGFCLEQELSGARWKRVADWTYGTSDEDDVIENAE